MSVSSDSLALMVALRGASQQDGGFAEEAVLLQLGDADLALVRVDQHVGHAAQDHVHGVAEIALMADLLAGTERHALAGEGQQLELGRLHLGEDRHAFENFDFLVEVHRVLLRSAYADAMRSA